MNLTRTQQAILAMITERIDADGVPPSQAEIASAFGFKGVRAAQYHLDALAQAGVIRKVPGQARGIRLVRSAEGVEDALVEEPGLRVPVLGQVAAGLPIGADPDVHAQVLLDPALFSPQPDYLLRVKGDSMRDEGILDGDLVGVRRSQDARSGQIVVARIDEEITIKVLKINRDHITLLPRNADYAPIEVTPDQDFAIEGLYCGLLRPCR